MTRLLTVGSTSGSRERRPFHASQGQGGCIAVMASWEHKMPCVEYETQNAAELPDLPTLAKIEDHISSLARATSTGRADDISISDIEAVPDSTKP